MKNSLIIILTSIGLLLSACSNKEPLVWVAGWQQTASVNEPRAGAAVVQANGYIYVIAGLGEKNFLKTTEYAKIQEDGSLGQWKPGPSLNLERAWMEGAFHNGYIYVVGGANASGEDSVYASNLLASVERAKINPDGSLSEWVTEKNSMVVPRRCNKVVVWNNKIYANGGFAGVMLDSVEQAEIQKDGSLGNWVLENERMLVPYYVHGVKAKKDALYVFGGHLPKKGIGMTNVEWSKISETGELGPWKNTNPLQAGRYGIASASHGDYFYVLGGFNGMNFLNSIEKSKLLPNGELTPWEYTSNLSMDRMDYEAIVYKDWIYVISGTNGKGYQTSVEYATFNEKGDIGFFGSKAQKEAYEKKAADKGDTKQISDKEKLRYSGIVLNLLHTGAHTYIEVAIKDANIWLAIQDPKIALNINDKILFGSGHYMPNFHSKELDRDFPKLFFIKEIQKADK